MGAQLAYIVAAGHSGSTLLDLVIGSLPGGFSTGEVTYLPWQISRREPGGPGASLQKICSCGAGFHECPVWTDIVAELSRQHGFDIYANPFQFRMNLMQNERFHASAFSRDRILRAAYMATQQVALLSPLGHLLSLPLQEAVSNNWLLFDTIATRTGTKFVVDSSKSPLRLGLLQRARPNDTFAVVLFRDIRGVVYSRQKLGHDPIRSARGWVRQYNRVWNALSRLKDLNLLCVSYEQLASEPAAERKRIGKFLGMDTAETEINIDTADCHLAAGNSMKHQGKLSIRLDEAWKENLDSELLSRIEEIRQGLNSGWEDLLLDAGMARGSARHHSA